MVSTDGTVCVCVLAALPTVTGIILSHSLERTGREKAPVYRTASVDEFIDTAVMRLC